MPFAFCLLLSCGGEEADPEPQELVVYTLAHEPPAGREALADWHELAVYAASVQGVVNRSGPRLFLDALEPDAVWLARMQAPGQPLAGVAAVRLADPVRLYERFADELGGLVAWDPDVPATLNVATSVAGAEDLAVVRADARPGSLLGRLRTSAAAPAVRVDLAGKFTGSGAIPDTARASSGSAKADAYLWLLERYVRPRKLEPRFAGYLIDARWLERPLGAATAQALNRDWLVAERAAVLDLSNWADERPVDDPGQPLGTDAATLRELLRALYELHGGSGITQLVGFTPWPWKYTSHPGAGGGRDPVTTEWDLARQASAYNVVLDADAFPYMAMANATLWRHAALPARREAPPAPDTRALRELGAWDNRLANPGFDDDDRLGGWTAQLEDAAAVTDPRTARGGVNLLAAGAGRLAQDVRVELAPGETLRASALVRAAAGTPAVTLAVRGLDAEAEQATSSARPGGGWQRVEAAFTARAAHASVRFELSVDAPADATLHADSAALWIDGRPAGVAPRQYLVWHMGDYDSAAWMYHALPRLWDDPRRGEVPLAWAFNPNLVDRFALGFAHVWATATPRDSLCAGDTVAGYVNLTQLYGARAPSGLPDARAAFEAFARPYLERAGVTTTIFALNAAAGPFDAAALDLLARLTPGGVAYHMAGQRERGPFLHAGVPFLGQRDDLDSADLARAAAGVYRATAGPGPGFHVFRTILATPAFVADLTRRIHRERPERRHTVLPAEALFELLRLHLSHGGTP